MSKKNNFDFGEVVSIGVNKPAADFGMHVDHTTQALEQVKAALAGKYQYLVNDEPRMTEVARLTVNIRNDSVKTVQTTLEIGLSLLAIREQLEEETVMDHFLGQNVLPFKKSYASKIMTVARDFKSNRFAAALGIPNLEPEALPPISVAYELHGLSDDRLKVAAKNGLLSPNTTVAMVRKYKQEIEAEGHSDDQLSRFEAKIALRKLRLRKATLEAKIAEINSEIDRAEAILARPTLMAAE